MDTDCEYKYDTNDCFVTKKLTEYLQLLKKYFLKNYESNS